MTEKVFLVLHDIDNGSSESFNPFYMEEGFEVYSTEEEAKKRLAFLESSTEREGEVREVPFNLPFNSPIDGDEDCAPIPSKKVAMVDPASALAPDKEGYEDGEVFQFPPKRLY
jgi:hypothetical protein